MRYSLWIVLLGGGFWLSETSFFGWNMVPHTAAEIGCDGLATLMLALALLCRAIERVRD